MSTPTLRWLQIHQYEQFEPVRIEFSERENLILGLNGAGKTQLLKLIWAVLSLNFRELIGKDVHVEFALASSAAGGMRAPLSISGEIIIAPDMDRTTSSGLAVKLLVQGDGRSFELELKNGQALLRGTEKIVLATAPENRDGSVAPHNFNWDSPRFTQEFDAFVRAMPQHGSCFLGDKDEEVQAFSSTLKFEMRSSGSRRWLWFDQAEFGTSDLRMWLDLFPLVDRLLRTQARDVLTVGVDPTTIGLDLGRLLMALNVRQLRLIPRSTRSAEERVEYRGIELRARFSGAEIADRDLTFGQRRALYVGLISQARPEVPVVCDEIDNGMHPRLVLALLEMWSDRQVFVASHNKLVIDSTNFFSPDDVREKIHIVRRRDDGRQVVKVFDEATAREIHANIDVKIQDPSDVLEAEGLW